MFHYCLFLSFLLISDAFTLPIIRQGVTNPDEFYQSMTRFMTFVMPLASMTMAFRTINWMAGMNVAIQLLSSMESVLNSAIERFGGMGEIGQIMMSSMRNGTRDTCLQRLVCELAIGSRQRNKRDLTNTVQVKSSQGSIPEQRIVINIKLSPNLLGSPATLFSSSSKDSTVTSSSSSSTPTGSTAVSSFSSDNTCERLFQSCPYSASDMFDALKKYLSVWRQVRIPRFVRAPFFEPLDLYGDDFNIFEGI